MALEFEDRKPEWRDAIQRFEQMLKQQEHQFFDLDAYEHIVEHYIGEGNWERALQACDLGLESFPYSLELMLDKAHLLSQNQEYDEALDLLERAALFNPSDLDVMLMQGEVLNLMGDHEQAAEIYELLLARTEDEQRDEILFQVGQSYQNAGKYEEAITFYKEALNVNMENENALYEMAFCLDVLGELESSIDFYNQLIERNPYSYNAWYNLGIVYSKLNRYDDALFAYDYATVIKEDFASAYFNMANAYMNLERYAEANEAFLKTLAHEPPTADLYCHLGASYEKMGDFEKAIKHYREALKLDNDWDEAWYGIAACLSTQEKWIEAMSCLRRAIKLNEHMVDYWIMMGELEYKIGHVLGSYAAFEKAAQLEPDFDEIWLKWSLVAFDQGDFTKAIDIILQGLDDIPDSADLYYRVTAYLLHKGEYREALLYLEIALTLDYDGHPQLYDFFPDVERQKALFKIIDQYRK